MHLPVRVKAEAAVVPVVKAEVDQVETDQAPELEATKVEVLAAVRVLPAVRVRVGALVEVLALNLRLLKNLV